MSHLARLRRLRELETESKLPRVVVVDRHRESPELTSWPKGAKPPVLVLYGEPWGTLGMPQAESMQMVLQHNHRGLEALVAEARNPPERGDDPDEEVAEVEAHLEAFGSVLPSDHVDALNAWLASRRPTAGSPP